MENAIASIRLGVADYSTGEVDRGLSAVRNLHAGLLLLFKAVLVQAAPRAAEDEVLGSAYVPQPDGQGGVRYVQRGARTVGLDEIRERLKSFGVTITVQTNRRLKSLAKLRNNVEHKYTTARPELVREILSDSLAVAAELFRHANVDPVARLGDAWAIMLGEAEVHAQERNACWATFADVTWLWQLAESATAECPDCGSDLLAQVDPTNTVQHEVNARCRACGSQVDAEDLVESLVQDQFRAEAYVAATDGGEPALHMCPECLRDTYVDRWDDDLNLIGCVNCEHKLGSCDLCGERLSPDTVAWDDSSLCGHCAHRLRKDD